MESKKQNINFQVSEIQLTYKTKVKPADRPRIDCSQTAFSILMESWNRDILELKEQFKILLLNRANKVLGIVEISSGGVAGTVSDPKLIFCAALKACACGLILCHNHPSGNLTASHADIELTRKLKEAGKLLEIQVLDHIILTASNKYFSVADEGLL